MRLNKGKERFFFSLPLKLWSGFLILLATSQPFNTYIKLMEGGVNVPNSVVFTRRMKCPWPCAFGERDYSFCPWQGKLERAKSSLTLCPLAAGDGADEKEPSLASRVIPRFSALRSSVLLLPAGLRYRTALLTDWKHVCRKVCGKHKGHMQSINLFLCRCHGADIWRQLELGKKPCKIHLARYDKWWGEEWSFPQARLWYPVFVMH